MLNKTYAFSKTLDKQYSQERWTPVWWQSTRKWAFIASLEYCFEIQWMKTSKYSFCSNLFEWFIYRIQCAMHQRTNALVQITTQNKYIFKYLYTD